MMGDIPIKVHWSVTIGLDNGLIGFHLIGDWHGRIDASET